jgi:two-component system sensor histidine kinase AgrC
MDVMPLVMVFVLSWPEAVLVSLFGLQLVGIKPKIPFLLLAGLLQAFSSYFVRAMPIDYGYHTIIQLIVYAVILWSVLKIPYITVQIAALIGFTCYLALESAVLPLTMQMMGLSMEKLFIQPTFRILAFIPQAVIFLTLLLIIKKRDIVLLRIDNTSKSKVDRHEH